MNAAELAIAVAAAGGRAGRAGQGPAAPLASPVRHPARNAARHGPPGTKWPTAGDAGRPLSDRFGRSAPCSGHF